MLWIWIYGTATVNFHIHKMKLNGSIKQIRVLIILPFHIEMIQRNLAVVFLKNLTDMLINLGVVCVVSVWAHIVISVLMCHWNVTVGKQLLQVVVIFIFLIWLNLWKIFPNSSVRVKDLIPTLQIILSNFVDAYFRVFVIMVSCIVYVWIITIKKDMIFSQFWIC